MDNYFSRASSALSSASSVIPKISNAILIFAGIVMATTFFLVVIVRYGFGANLFAYEEWLMTIAFWMFFIGSSVATNEQRHIKADIIGCFLTNEKWVWTRSILVLSIEFIILATITYWGLLMCQEEIASYPSWQSTIALKIPFFVPRLGIFIGFLLMTFYTALHIYKLIRNSPFCCQIKVTNPKSSTA